MEVGTGTKSKEMELDESKNNRGFVFTRIYSQIVKKTFSDSTAYVIEINGPGIGRRARERSAIPLSGRTLSARNRFNIAVQLLDSIAANCQRKSLSSYRSAEEKTRQLNIPSTSISIDYCTKLQRNCIISIRAGL
jgi:hypothetical protein